MLSAKVKLALISLLLVASPAISCRADTVANSASVVINEIQTNGAGTGATGQEFVEIKNISNQNIDISDWKLQYLPSTGNLSSAKIFVAFPANTIIYPGGYILATPSDYLPDITTKFTYIINSSFGGLSATGATVSLLNNNDELIDRVGWGTNSNTLCELERAVAPQGGQSIERMIVSEVPQDTNNNKNDFIINILPSPDYTNENPNPDTDNSNNTDNNIPPSGDTSTGSTDTSNSTGDELNNTNSDPPTDNSQQPASYPMIELSELYIDPVAPLIDSNDEWVEIYNPGEAEVDLSDYQIFTGTNSSYHYTFPNGAVIGAKQYLTVTSGDTAIALSNSGGGAKIMAPDGTLLDQTSYDAAKTGYSWAKGANGQWQWTFEPTKDMANKITVEPVAIITVAAKKVTATKTKTTASASSTKKVAATKAKTTKVKAASTEAADQPALIAAPTPLPNWLLAILGVLAILYACYEYRFEVSNKIYQFKQYFKNR